MFRQSWRFALHVYGGHLEQRGAFRGHSIYQVNGVCSMVDQLMTDPATAGRRPEEHAGGLKMKSAIWEAAHCRFFVRPWVERQW